MAHAKHSFDYDLIVIGSGAGGSAAATIAAKAGLRVAIIEADTFGGESPNWSDVPMKALLHAAHLYDEARHGSRFGLRTSTLGYNYPSLRTWKDLAVQRTGAGGNRRFYENQGISAYEGTAHFISPHEISVNRRHLSARYFVVATGSSWSIPRIQGLNTVDYHTPRTLLESIRPPKSLLIIGGGRTAVETAQLMAIFGTKVHIVEKAARLLPEFDQEVGELLEKYLADNKGVTTLTETRVLSVVKDGIGKRVTISRGGSEKTIRVDEILVATGREPNVDLGLDNAHVKYSAKGIEVNEQLQTSAKHIYAAGDVLGNNRGTHTALLESRIVAHNIMNKNAADIDYSVDPQIVYAYPSVAHVGLSQDDCLKRDMPIKVATAPLNLIARSNTSDFRDGFVKLIAGKNGALIGATIVAPAAEELIHELSLAIRHGLTAQDIAHIPHAFLSWSEAIRVAASKLG